MDQLTGYGNYQNYDTHYVPVKHQHSDTYIPVDEISEALWDEYVFFQGNQVFPRYVIHLREKISSSSSSTASGSASSSPLLSGRPPIRWSVDEVCAWMATLSLTRDYSEILRANGVDGDLLLSEFHSGEDWKEFGFDVVGDVRRLNRAVGQLRQNQ
jgi:hypothetical protein